MLPQKLTKVNQSNWKLLILDYPGKCNYNGRILDPGTHQSPDRCVRITCSSSGYVTTASCGKKAVQGCEAGELVDKTKDYPECCLQYFNCNGTIITK